ncbi:restriction endonuclease subunit S [Lactococcus raffinolactis]|uniref:restriction endonuclease subunit S n=1 Tax=Pseudolactococcus raffinolactis TaxID=1366 RepID=UPI0034CFCF6F
MNFKNLSEVSDYVNERVKVENLTVENYISTENMLPNKGGIDKAIKLPAAKTTSLYSKGDILLSNIRTYFKKIWYAEKDGGCSNDVLVVRARGEIEPKFLYYVLSNDKFFEYSSATSKGTKMPRGDKSAIMQYQIPDMPLEEQRTIVSVLSALDDRIAENKKINHHLLEQAIAIHKYFCVELVDDTFVTETVKSISNEVVTGKTPSTKIKEYYGGSLPFITIPDMHGNVFCVETARYLTNVGEQSQQRKTLPAKSIAVSCIATPGLVCLLDRPSQTNQQINSVIPKENQEYYLFLELLSKSQLIIELGSSGSTTYNLNKTQFEKIEILATPIEKRGQINQMLSPLFDELNHIQHENNRLIELRDTLLPKLMSGELSVSQAAK